MGTLIEKLTWVALCVAITGWLAYRVWRARSVISPAELPRMDSDLLQYEPALAALLAERRARNNELKAAVR